MLLRWAIFDNTPTTDLDEQKSIMDVAMKVVSNVNLDKVGVQMVADAEAILGKYGFALKGNKKHAQKPDLLKGKTVEALNKAGQVLAGRWVSPHATQSPFVHHQTWLLESVRIGMANKLNSDVPNEYFLCVSARLTNGSGMPRMTQDLPTHQAMLRAGSVHRSLGSMVTLRVAS